MEALGMIVTIVLLCWYVFIRNIIIYRRYKEETGISIPDTMTEDELYARLQTDLQYPGLKEVKRDEHGQITISCTYGKHVLRFTPGRLYIRKHSVFNGKCVRDMEEAECLKVYIQKMLFLDVPQELDSLYNKFNRFYKMRKKVCRALIIIAILFLIVAISESGIVAHFQSDGISTSCLDSYSSYVTIGEAFNNYFTNGSWKAYESGIQEYVDFKGNCYWDDEQITMIITFFSEDDYFSIANISIDGVDVSEYAWADILEEIYTKS